MYRFYQVISRDLRTIRSGERPVQIAPKFSRFCRPGQSRPWSEPTLDFTFFRSWSALEPIGISPWIPGHTNESLYRWTGLKKEVRPKWKDTVDSNRTVFKYSFQLPFDVKFKKLELQIESGTELRKQSISQTKFSKIWYIHNDSNGFKKNQEILVRVNFSSHHTGVLECSFSSVKSRPQYYMIDLMYSRKIILST